MPLILITGLPTSGKTFRATQLHTYLESRILSLPLSPSSSTALRVHHLHDSLPSLSIPRSAYDLSTLSAHERSATASEKDARAKVYAEVKRLLSARDIVICDAAAGNYIKGWRYQLYCEAKALRTVCCVVHVGTEVGRARGVNEGRLRERERLVREGERGGDGGGGEGGMDGEGEEQPYDPEAWENLVYRFEEPNGMTRWDSPLFTVLWDDVAPPCEAIWEAMFGPSSAAEKGKGSGAGGVVVRPNQATVMKASAGEDYLYELDRGTREVVGRIAEWVGDHVGEEGGVVRIDGKGDKGDGDMDEDGKGDDGALAVRLPVGGSVNLPALQRLRRLFIALNRKNTVPIARIKESFVGYLNGSFEAA